MTDSARSSGWRSQARFRWFGLIAHGLVLSALALVIHGAWEVAQCPLFFEHGSYDASWRGMLGAALGDVVLTWLVYGSVALISRRWRWAAAVWSVTQLCTLLGVALALAIFVELRALQLGLWSYTPRAPRLPLLGVSLVPLVQLVVLTPVVIALSEKLTRRVMRDSVEQDDSPAVRARYDRIARFYDAGAWMMERVLRRWRPLLWARVQGGQVLELGVGTGTNIPFYPPGASVTAVDFSKQMLARARVRAAKLGVNATFAQADIERLPYPDESFDAVIATCVFCSVGDPVAGLREAKRVLRPGGKLLLLEHVLSQHALLRSVMNWLDAVPAHLWGAHINRETEQRVAEAGFEQVTTQNLRLDIVKLIEAEK